MLMTTPPPEEMDETIEVFPPPTMLTAQFCTLVVEQAINFLDNLSSLDSSYGISTSEIFQRRSRILPGSEIGRHLR